MNGETDTVTRKDNELPRDVEKLEGIVLNAGSIAKDFFERRSEFLVDEKSPGQFVSDADREVEDFLRKELKTAFGDREVVGEEFGGTYTGDGWVIDPIDGTSNFLCGMPLWSVSVAYMLDGKPVLGAVYSPVLDMMVSAEAGQGLRKNQLPFVRNAGKTAVPTFSVGENTVWPLPEIRLTTEKLRRDGFEILRLRSASLSLAMASIGLLEGFTEKHLKLWDIAAGWLLCLEGGMDVSVTELREFERSIYTQAT